MRTTAFLLMSLVLAAILDRTELKLTIISNQGSLLAVLCLCLMIAGAVYLLITLREGRFVEQILRLFRWTASFALMAGLYFHIFIKLKLYLAGLIDAAGGLQALWQSMLATNGLASAIATATGALVALLVFFGKVIFDTIKDADTAQKKRKVNCLQMMAVIEAARRDMRGIYHSITIACEELKQKIQSLPATPIATSPNTGQAVQGAISDLRVPVTCPLPPFINPSRIVNLRADARQLQQLLNETLPLNIPGFMMQFSIEISSLCDMLENARLDTLPEQEEQAKKQQQYIDLWDHCLYCASCLEDAEDSAREAQKRLRFAISEYPSFAGSDAAMDDYVQRYHAAISSAGMLAFLGYTEANFPKGDLLAKRWTAPKA